MASDKAFIANIISWNAFKDSIAQLHDNNCFKTIFQGIFRKVKNTYNTLKNRLFNDPPEGSNIYEHYVDIFRRKKRWELIILSSAVCGIEFCYAAETAFVTPIMLSLGLDMKFATMIWCLSPIIGFFATPILGTLSDRCMSKLGRRRPFIILLSIGILAGLILIPNGESLGVAVGDSPISQQNYSEIESTIKNANYTSMLQNSGNTNTTHRWGILFTVIGVILLDFCSDAGQSPSRTYLLDVTVSEDHKIGLSTFTMMAGFGGSIGYLMGCINWKMVDTKTFIGGHVKFVFTFVTVLYTICLFLTIFSFAEIPLYILNDDKKALKSTTEVGTYAKLNDENNPINNKDNTYGTIKEQNSKLESNLEQDETTLRDSPIVIKQKGETPTQKEYFLSILHMPKSLKLLCLTHFFSWMSLLCYSLYFTDFVGESVFGGDPKQPENSVAYQLYGEGVKFGSGGMAFYSIFCSFYSYGIDSLIQKYGAKSVYIGGQLVYSIGMVLMAVCRHKVAVILLSPTAGVMYATLFTIPYLLVANYHSKQKFNDDSNSENSDISKIRGIGTDIAIISSMVFLAQFLLSLSMGSIMKLVESSVAVIVAASILGACGAISASQLLYLEL